MVGTTLGQRAKADADLTMRARSAPAPVDSLQESDAAFAACLAAVNEILGLAIGAGPMLTGFGSPSVSMTDAELEWTSRQMTPPAGWVPHASLTHARHFNLADHVFWDTQEATVERTTPRLVTLGAFPKPVTVAEHRVPPY